MTFLERLHIARERAGGCLCIGLDPHPEYLPEGFLFRPGSVERFLTEIIEATKETAAAYKPNTAFYEALGADGWRVLERLREKIPPDVLWIVDAKRADIASTGEAYAEALFTGLGADAVTVNPYLGSDALDPFLKHAEKGVFVLIRTSNPGAGEVQEQPSASGGPLYETIASLSLEWAKGKPATLGWVVGATRPQALQRLREKAPAVPFLIPGVGAQGGELSTVLSAACGETGAPVLVNISRAVLYASRGKDFAQAAGRAARRWADQMRMKKG